MHAARGNRRSREGNAWRSSTSACRSARTSAGSPELRIKGDIAAGDQFRVSHLATTCHGFTHVDAQAHFVAHAPTIEATPLSRVVGPARVIDLRDVAPNTRDRRRAARAAAIRAARTARS